MYTKSRKASFENCFNKITKKNYPRYALKYICTRVRKYNDVLSRLKSKMRSNYYTTVLHLTNVPNLLMQFCDVSYFLILVANHHKRTFQCTYNAIFTENVIHISFSQKKICRINKMFGVKQMIMTSRLICVLYVTITTPAASL